MKPASKKKRQFQFDQVDAELSNRMKNTFRLTLKKNSDQFNEDTLQYGYRPDKITTLDL